MNLHFRPPAFLVLSVALILGGRQSLASESATPATQPAAQPASQPPAESADPLAANREAFSTLLGKLVTDKGLVRYYMLEQKRYRTALESIVEHYAAMDSPEDKTAQLAAYCNAYNANVLLKVARLLDEGEVESVLKVEGFFDKQTITVAGRELTLNQLENDVIRPFGDARIHAALVCAAKSCPVLRNEAFHPTRLDTQLDEQCRRWINDITKNGAQRGMLRVSRIFEWYGEDFKGDPFNGVAGFVKKYAADGTLIVDLLERNPDPEISFVEYDWALNIARR
jgi:hypothetical protein